MSALINAYRHNLLIQGSGNAEVTCVREELATESEYVRSNNLVRSEKLMCVMHLKDYNLNTLKALVHYVAEGTVIYPPKKSRSGKRKADCLGDADDEESHYKEGPADEEEQGAAVDDELSHYLSLLLCADFLQMPGLIAMTIDQLEQSLNSQKKALESSLHVLRSTFLQRRVDSSSLGRLTEVAMQHIRDWIGTIQEENYSSLLSQLPVGVMQEILFDGSLQTYESHLFTIVQWWVRANNATKEDAKKLVELLSLEMIEPDFIHQHIEGSGYIEEGRLTEAHRKQAIQAKKQYDHSFGLPRAGWSKKVGSRVPEKIKIMGSGKLTDGVLTRVADKKYCLKGKCVDGKSFDVHLGQMYTGGKTCWVLGARRFDEAFIATLYISTSKDGELCPKNGCCWEMLRRNDYSEFQVDEPVVKLEYAYSTPGEE